MQQKNCLFCVVSHKKFKIVVFNKGKLTFFNSFEYQNSSDILYFLLATCQNIKMNIDKVNLNYILNLKVEDLIENTKNFYSKFNVVYDSSIDKQDYIYS